MHVDHATERKAVSRGSRWLPAIFVVAMAAACSSSGTPSDSLLLVPFRHQVIDADPDSGETCCTDVCALGDLNGDGLVDVILGSENAEGAGLVWYESPAWERHPIARGEFTTDGKAADIDGDGDLDVVGSNHGRGIFWYENPSGAGSGDWVAHLIGPGYAHDLEVGDLDADGDADVVTCDKKEVVFWRQVEPSRWTRHSIVRREGEGIALGDLDGDGDLDVVHGSEWLETPYDPGMGRWATHVIAHVWPADTRARVADMNGDGRADVVLAVSEGKGKVAWFEAPTAPTSGPWRSHPIERSNLEGAHSLQVADLDGDGSPDVITAEMHTSKNKRVLNYLNRGDDTWEVQVLSVGGSHNMQAADLDGDGDVDLVGKNYGGPGRTLELWENLTADILGGHVASAAPFLGEGWRYVAVDDERPEDQRGKTGLVFADVDRDGRTDIVAGSLAYRNPGRKLERTWSRVSLGEGVDVYFDADVDGDDRPDLVGVRGNEIVWLEASAPGSGSWSLRPVGAVPEGRTQGYVRAQIEAGGKEELVFTRGKNLLYLCLPETGASSENWRIVSVSSSNEEEGVAAGDIDRDGDIDLAAADEDGHQAIWYENPGDGSGNWARHPIGPTSEWLDRIGLADVNGDGRLDAVASEETQDWQYNANIYWFESPVRPAEETWTRHTVTTLRSVNSMTVIDIDKDGDPDIVAAEHTDQQSAEGAPNNLTVILENDGRGDRWRAKPVEVGPHSSHLGARVVDLDGDGDFEIVSIGWKQYRALHLWYRPKAPPQRKQVP